MSMILWWCRLSLCLTGRSFCWTRTAPSGTSDIWWCVLTMKLCWMEPGLSSEIWLLCMRSGHIDELVSLNPHLVLFNNIMYKCLKSRICSLKRVLERCFIVLQSCRLGQHRPISKTYADGIMTVNDTASKPLTDQPLNDWLPKIVNSSSEAFTKLRLYSHVCRNDLGTFWGPSSCTSKWIDVCHTIL